MIDLPSPAAASEGQAARTRVNASWLPVFLLLPLCVSALAPLVRGPLFASADGLLHLYRLVEFDRGIRAGIFYPRWAPDLLAGYGYPIFVFYGPFLYYLAEAFHLAGLGFADALKAAVGAGMVASAAGMYVFARDLWGRWGALLAAAAYLYAPYRLVNTYLDGELAQTLAWAWLPWLAWAAWRWLRTGRVRYGVLAAVCYAGLISTHSVTSWLATLFLGLALAATLAARARYSVGHAVRAYLTLGGFLALGAGLAAPYWLPALAEQAYVQLDRVRIATYDFHTNLLPLDRVLSTAWAHDYAGYLGVNGPAQVGLIQALVALAGLVALAAFARRKHYLAPAATAGLFAALTAIALVLMLRPAAVFWEHVPFGRFLQFPDRLLLVVAFCGAVLAGGLALPLRRWRGAAPAAALLGCAALAYGATARLDVNDLALPPTLGPAQVTAYEQVSGAFGTTAKGEFTPRWLGAPPLTSPLVQSELTGALPAPLHLDGATVTVTQRGPESLHATVQARQAERVELPVAYYPGWSAPSGAVQPGPHGLASIEVPAGQSAVSLSFGATPDRRLADALGFASALVLAALALVRLRRLGAASTEPAAVNPSAAQTLAPEQGSKPSAKSASWPHWRVLALGFGYARAARAEGTPAAAKRLQALGRAYGPGGIALLAGGLVLAVGLMLTPGKWQLGPWPVQRPELVSYAGWLQLMGADVSLQGDHVHVTAAFRTGNAANARPVTATVRVMTREVVWGADTEQMPVAGWVTAVPRKLEFDVPLAAGTPPGVYALEMEVVFDGGVIGPDSTRLSYGTPRVGKVTLGPLAIGSPIGGDMEGQQPAASDFGPLQLAGWQPPQHAEQGQLVPIDLWWRAATAPSGNWGISVHVVDAAGQVWSGHDDQPRLAYNPTSEWPAGQLERDVQMVLLPHGMPPGEYQVLAGWYDAAGKGPVGPQNVAIGQMAVAPASHPDARLLEVPHALSQDFPDGLRLLGYDLPATHATAGQPLALRLFWQATARPAKDDAATIGFGAHAVTIPLPHTSQWQAGQLMETRLTVPTQPDWAGSGPLAVSLNGQPPTVQLPVSLTLDAPPRLLELPPGLSHPSPDTLTNTTDGPSGTVKLAGYRETIAGGKLALRLYWQPLTAVAPNLHVFAHVLDSQNHVVAQHDGVPGQGQRPTGGWTAGEYVEDVHEVALPSSGGPWQIEVGLYDPTDGKRLGDRLLLAPISAG